MARIKISDFTTDELDVLRARCNFTPDEGLFFDLAAAGWDLTGIKSRMGDAGLPCSESTVARLSGQVRRKITIVYRQHGDNFLTEW